MKYIVLTQGFRAKVNNRDFARAGRFDWFAQRKGKTVYAARHGREGEASSYVYLHRFILGIWDDREVDHKNGFGLDCRRRNLRVCRGIDNRRAFRAKSEGKYSRFRGVTWDKIRQTWQAQLCSFGKTKFLGRFKSERAAARAYDAAAIRLFGEFASPNFS